MSKTLSQIFADNIFFFAEKKGMDVNALAESMGSAAGYFTRVRNGKDGVSFKGLEFAKEVSDKLGISLDEMLVEHDDSQGKRIAELESENKALSVENKTLEKANSEMSNELNSVREKLDAMEKQWADMAKLFAGFQPTSKKEEKPAEKKKERKPRKPKEKKEAVKAESQPIQPDPIETPVEEIPAIEVTPQEPGAVNDEAPIAAPEPMTVSAANAAVEEDPLAGLFTDDEPLVPTVPQPEPVTPDNEVLEFKREGPVKTVTPLGRPSGVDSVGFFEEFGTEEAENVDDDRESTINKYIQKGKAQRQADEIIDRNRPLF